MSGKWGRGGGRGRGGRKKSGSKLLLFDRKIITMVHKYTLYAIVSFNKGNMHLRVDYLSQLPGNV